MMVHLGQIRHKNNTQGGVILMFVQNRKGKDIFTKKVAALRIWIKHSKCLLSQEGFKKDCII